MAFHCCMAVAVSATDRSTSAGTTVASCSANSGVALRTIACTWPPDSSPLSHDCAVIGKVRSFLAVEETDLALLDVMPAWYRSHAVIDVAPSSSHMLSASNSPTALTTFAVSRSMSWRASAKASLSSGISNSSTASRNAPNTP